MRRMTATALIAAGLLSAGTAQAGLLDFGAKERKQKEAQEAELKTKAQSAESSLKEMEQKYKDLEIDRNNVLAQTKQLLADRAKMTDLEAKYASLDKGVKTLMSQKDRLLTENQSLKKELASIVENHDRLKENFQELQVRENSESTEVTTLREQLVRRVEASPQYMLVQNESKAVRQENENLKKTVAELDSKLKKALEFIRKIQDRDFKYVQQLGALKTAYDKVYAQNQALTQTNRSLNETIDQAPSRVSDLAKQNERLVRETAQMHYNMGVLFTENEKYDLAAKEFERALAIDPNDQKSHYNLGYLYAEQFSKPEQATEHFKRFLELDPQSQQAEAVKSYLVQKHTYSGKSLEKGSGNPF